MDERLFTLIMCHLATVGGSVRLLIDSGISLPTSVGEWISDPDARTGTLKYGCHFRKYDFGCSIHCPASGRDAVIQFGPRGETFGFTREHILSFARELSPSSYHFKDEDEIGRAFTRAREIGRIADVGNGLYCLMDYEGNVVCHDTEEKE